MSWPRIRSAKLRSVALAGAVVLSTLIAPSMLPPDLGGSAARAEIAVDINIFFGALSPYGRWIDSPRYGPVWHPASMRPGWRPYYHDGHWAYSHYYGWVWVSDMPWGWAPFHYGRWAFDPYVGWIWVPGRVWGPAWVTFRMADDAIGWAPLPPEIGWDPGYGYRGGGDIYININFWSFVRPEGFTARRFDRYAYDRHQYPTIINRTTNITNITIINNRIVNNSIQVNDIERYTNQKVERVQITESDQPGQVQLNGDNVRLYKPMIIEQGEANANVDAGQQPAQIKEDPAQDNKKRVVRVSDQPTDITNDGQSQEQVQPEAEPASNKQGKQPQLILPPANDGSQNLDQVQPEASPASKKQGKQQQDLLPPVYDGGQGQDQVQPEASPASKKQGKQQQELLPPVDDGQSQDQMQPEAEPASNKQGKQPQLILPPANDGSENLDQMQPEASRASKKQGKQQQELLPPVYDGQSQDQMQPEANPASNDQGKQREQGQPGGKKKLICGEADQAPCQ